MSSADKIKLNGIAAGATANSPSATAPKANGTAAVGTEAGYARGDHVHPLQTAVSGNAGTATKWATARNINGMSVQGDANRANYGTCSTAAATAAKVVACTGFALITGAEIAVKFTVTNTASNPTLNVNSTGAKPIFYRGAAISAGYLAANRTYAFRYNGTQYELVGDINTNTTYNNVSQTADGLMLAADKKKLDGVEDGAQKNPTDYLTGGSQTATSTADGGSNVFTFSKANGTTGTFTVKNGSKGATGTRGSQIYWGTAITGTSTTATIFSNSGLTSALVNDLYLNTLTWNIYQCTTAGNASTAKWVYKGNIKGATGAVPSMNFEVKSDGHLYVTY